jgi:hypothetical protein
MALQGGRSLPAALLLTLLGLAPSCTAGDQAIVRRPVPPMDKLRTDDCPEAIETYRQLLALPSHAAVVITGRPVPPPPLFAQEQALLAFSQRCQGELAGQARRAIVSCWHDSADASSFRACNDRF